MTSNCHKHMTDLGLFLIRTIVAVVFIYHGGGKLFGWFGGSGLQATAGFMGKLGIPYPMAGAVLSGSAEFFGGVLLLTGVAARLAAIPMAFNMAVACLTAHHGFNGMKGGMEYPLTLGVVLAGLVLTGPGGLSLCRFCPCRCGLCRCGLGGETPAAPAGPAGPAAPTSP